MLTGFGGQYGYEYRDIFYSSAYTSARLSMTFLNGAVLSGGDLRGYGFVAARNGGKIINTHIRGITANVGASGYASGLTATTESTGSAYDTNIYVYGSGALAENTVLSGGFLAVEGGGTVNGITMMAPEGYNGPAGDAKTIGPAEMEITAGGRANNAVASAGLITLYNGSYKEAGVSAATLSNADIHSAATLLVNEDGVVLDGTLNLGGTVVTTAERDEWIEVEVTDPDTGDVYTDWQRVTKNNAVANASTLTVNFDLTERNGSEEGAMIDNLANLEGAKLGTITVTADQAGGQYVLAQGAEDFTGTISVKVSDEKLGDFSVGTIWQYAEDTVFTLTNNANVGLCFTVQNTAAVVEDIIATVDGKELLKGQWTNKAVTIKTSVNQYSQSIWYKIKKAVVTRKAPADDGWTQLDNDTGITVSEYCSVDFMALNAKGQQSRVVTYTVNYDATAAEIGDLRSEAGDAELHDGDESQVSVLVTDDLDEAPTVELLSGADWTALEQGSDGRYAFTVTGNGEYTLRATDHAGNVTTQAVTVDFYTGGPAALPTVLSATPDTTAPTNKNVTVTAAFSGNAAKKEYRIGSGNWVAYTGPVVMENNGTVSFRAGNAKGYSDATEVVVNNIDRVPPEQPASEASTTAPTNQNVTVIAVFSDDSVKKEYSLDGQTWKAYGNGVTMQDNGTVFFRGIDAAGNVSPVESCVVANIDKIPPATPAGMEVTVFEDRARVVWDEVADDGLAPLAGYGIRYGNSADLSGDGEMVDGSMKQFTDLTPGDWYYQVRTCDSAGNASDWSELQSFKIDDSAVNKLNVLSGGSGSEVVTHDSEGNVVVLDTATGTTKSLGTLDRSQWDILGTGKETSGGVPELLVQNRETGAVYLTDNAAGTVSDASVQSGTLLGVVPAGTELAGVGNFNGSGHPGALLIEPEQQHGSSKETQLDCWTVSEDGQAESAPLGSIFTTWDGDKLNIPASLTDEAEINSRYYSFDVAGIGDFNGDGKDDVMIRNTMPGTVDGKKITGAGDIFVCLTGVAPQNGQKINAVYTGCAPDPWRIAGFGDLNGDNITDVILENTSDGEIASWLLNSSGQYASAAHIGTLTAGQVFAGVSDVDNDKVADVLFTDFDGSLHAWTVQNGAAKGQIALS